MAALQKLKTFSNFLDISSIFRKESPEDNIEKQKLMIAQNIQKEVDYFIDAKKPDMIVEFCKNGYVFTTAQIENIVQTKPFLLTSTPYLLENLNNYPEALRSLVDNNINYMLKQITKLRDKITKLREKTDEWEWISTDFLKQDHDNWDTISFVVKHYADIYQNDKASFHGLREQVKTIEKHYAFNYERTKTIAKNKDFESTRENFAIMQKLISRPELFINQIDNLYISLNKNQLQQDLHNTSLVFGNLSTNISVNVSTLLQREVAQFDLSKLPGDAAAIVQDIQQQTVQISSHELNETQKVALEILIGKRFPQVFRDYLGISENYRNILTTPDGKKADDLLIESLQSIQNELGSLLEIKEENSFTNLQTTHRYLKNRAM